MTELENIQEKLTLVEELKYIDEDWGQLDDYGRDTPVKWPCCLIDIQGIDYTNIGLDKSAKPMQRQEGTATVILKFANLKLTNSSAKSPLRQKETSWLLSKIMQKAHEQIQGFRPSGSSGSLIRTAMRRIKRDDGIQAYQVIYSIGLHDV